MKKKLLCILLTICFVFGGVMALAGCSGASDNPPSTALEYAQWLINNMKSTYSVSVQLDYKEDERFPQYKFEGMENVSTYFSALVKKSGNTRVSTVYAVTSDYNLDAQNRTISETKVEFTESGANYGMKLFSDRKKSVVTTSLSEDKYVEEASKMLLPEALLSLAVKGGEANIKLYPNTAPDKYYEDGRGPSEEVAKKFTILTYSGYASYESDSDNTWVFLSFIVYENKLSAISYQENGKTDNKSYRHEGVITCNDVGSSTTEPFTKTGYYSSEAECATAMLDGVFGNQPARYQVAVSETITVDTTTIPSTGYYVAYEKEGDTEYYYEKSSAADEWHIEESYTRNGNGHIGRTYNRSDMTYKEKVCDEHLCFYTSADYEDQHAYINVMNTSFLSLAQMLNSVDYAEVDFDGDVCTLTFDLPSEEEGLEVKTVIVIEGTVLKKLIIEQSTESYPDISEMPDMPSVPGMPDFTGSKVVIKTTSTFTYDTDAINADLSGYTKAQ